jgi:hypothetical protein
MRSLMSAAAVLLAILAATPAEAGDRYRHGHGWGHAPSWRHGPPPQPRWHRPARPSLSWHGWRQHERPRHAWRDAPHRHQPHRWGPRDRW